MSLLDETFEEFDFLFKLYERTQRLANGKRRGPVVTAAAYVQGHLVDRIVELHKQCIEEDPANSKDVVMRSLAMLEKK